tara:strand:+ start:1804 stop:2463 length:660 start_codon:yes stop_codon:yes gene_type:complete
VSEIQRLRNIVAKLRSPDGCPWDIEQTHHSLVRCLVEEVSEVIEAIDNLDSTSMEEELGDLLLQVVMHARLAEEDGNFDLEDVARGIADKLIRRHPHVFGDDKDKMQSSEEVIDRWELIKAKEKEDSGKSNEPFKIFKDLPPRLPSLLFAFDIYKRASKHGLLEKGEWSEIEVDKKSSGMDEDSVGHALFEIVASCQKKGIDPESALRRYASRQVDILS